MLRVFESDHVEVATHEFDIFHRPVLLGHNFVHNPSLELLKERASISEVTKHCIPKKVESVPRNFLGVSFHIIEKSFGLVLSGIVCKEVESFSVPR